MTMIVVIKMVHDGHDDENENSIFHVQSLWIFRSSHLRLQCQNWIRN